MEKYLSPIQIRAEASKNIREQEQNGDGLPVSYQEVNEAIARAAADNVVEWLASQCGDGCGSCSLYGTSCRPEETSDFCEFIRIWMSGYAKCEAERDKLAGVLREAKLQIEYLHEKFQETGTGNTILARIDAVLTSKGIGRP